MYRNLAALAVAVVLASGVGFANSMAKAMGMNQARPVADTRTSRHGVCAYADTGRGLMGGGSSVKACARTLEQGGAPSILVSEFTSGDEAEANPGNWHLVFTAPDGRVLLEETFPMQQSNTSALDRASCFLASSCLLIARQPEPLREAWAPGTYRAVYTYLPTNKPVEMSITLQ